jgi:hypothetical protein
MRAMMGAMVIVAFASASAPAQDEDVSDHVSMEIDVGILGDYDDSNLWGDSYEGGVTGLWELSAATFLCARFGLSHWSYASGSVVESLVPPGSEIVFEKSSGQLEILALTPMIRYQREDVFPWRLGAFVQAGVGLAYVKTFALTEVEYTTGPVNTDVAEFTIDTNDWFVEAFVGAGLSRPISSSSWIDVFPSYRAIFADDTAHVFGISAGFRVRV